VRREIVDPDQGQVRPYPYSRRHGGFEDPQGTHVVTAQGRVHRHPGRPHSLERMQAFLNRPAGVVDRTGAKRNPSLAQSRAEALA